MYYVTFVHHILDKRQATAQVFKNLDQNMTKNSDRKKQQTLLYLFRY